jgi:glycosyltransferase 2 family protein
MPVGSLGQLSHSSPTNQPTGRSSTRRTLFLKLAVTITLYVLIFRKAEIPALAGGLANAHLWILGGAVVLYLCGQLLSAYKWQLLLRPVGLTVRYSTVSGFYFVGMFFNLFLPTIIGGDAVKAILLARHTGSPAGAAVSVFMERNVGLLALITISIVAAWMAPSVELMGVPLTVLTPLLLAGFVGANLVLFSPRVYHLADVVLSRTTLVRVRSAVGALYASLQPFSTAIPVMVASFALSLVFQFIVILMVFLNSLALGQAFPLAVMAVFVPLISVASMLPISVNGLGVREALYVMLFGRLGAPIEAALALALLHLAVTLATSLPGGLVYLLQRSGRKAAPLPAAAERSR